LISFGEQNGVQYQALKIGDSQAIGGSEANTGHSIKKPLGLAAFAPATGMEKHHGVR
jgi:hypothetical protein